MGVGIQEGPASCMSSSVVPVSCPRPSLSLTVCVPPCLYCNLVLQDQHNSIAKFLEAKGMPEVALEVATDADYRFELAVSLGMLDLALELAGQSGEAGCTGVLWGAGAGGGRVCEGVHEVWGAQS